AHEHHDRVAPGEDADTADGEQDRGQHDVLIHGCSSVLAVAPDLPDVPGVSAGSMPSERWTSSMSSARSGAERTVPRAASTRDTEASAAVPSGSRAGVSTALCLAKTPGAGSGPRCRPFSA